MFYLCLLLLQFLFSFSFYMMFFQHIYERVTMPSTAASFPDEVEVEVEVSPTEFDSRTPVSSSFLSLSFS